MRVPSSGRLRFAVAAGLLVVLLAVVAAPLAVVVAGSVLDPRFLGLTSESWETGSRHATWFSYVLSLYGRHLARSAVLALLVVALAFVVGAPAAYGLSRRKDAFARAMAVLLDAPLAVPGLAMAIGLLLAYPRARSSGATLAAGHLLYALPFFVRAAGNALSGADAAELEEAAAVSGAGRWQRFRRVVLPLARPGLLAGALMAFTISWGEFNVSFLLATPTTSTFPSALYLTYTTNSFPVAAAATTLFLAAAVPALALLQSIASPEAARFGEAA
ncbi:MAG: ABC transporter permease subunit [Acidobacteriota bacterium]